MGYCGGVSCRELFRIGRIGNLCHKFPRECARRAGKGASGSLLTQTARLRGAAGMADENAGSERRSETLRFRLSEPEAQAYRAFCDNHNLSVTEALRRMARAPPGSVPHFPARVIRRLSN